MCDDEDNGLKDQGNEQGCTAAPLNALECGPNHSLGISLQRRLFL